MSRDEPTPKYVPFGAGLDTETDAIRVKPGSVIGSSNYEPGLLGAYERSPGYERMDGRPAPSDAALIVVSGVFTVAVGATVTGTSSSASGVVAAVDAGAVAMTKVTGTFSVGEVLMSAGLPIGVAGPEPGLSALDINRLTAACENIYRADIQKVPGSGPIRGGAGLKGVLYAMRDDAAGTAQAIYKATPAGWVLVPLMFEIAFNTGSAEPVEGATIARGGVTATVKRVVLETGEWGTANAAGRLIVTGITGGTFTAGVLSSGGSLNLLGAQAAITLAPGGRWIWRQYNFAGSTDTIRLYGVDGKNRPMEFDGETLVPLNTGQTGSFPRCIEVHRNHLWVSYRGSLQHSGVSDPYQWTILSGADEIGLGDDITNLWSVSGNQDQAALLATCENRYGVVYGNDSTDFNMVPVSLEAGAAPYTVQQMGKVVALDNAGVRDFTPTQNFGNFNSVTLTAHIQRRAADLSPVASVLDRKRSRYRLFFSQGRQLVGAPGKRWAWLFSDYPCDVNIAFECEIAGESRIFLGAVDGFLYELRDCRSFDGAAIEHWLKTSYTHLDSPGRRKAFRRYDVHMRTQSAGVLSFQPEFSFGDPDIEVGSLRQLETPAPPTQWDIDRWDSGSWDGQFSKALRFRTPGIGENVAQTFYNISATELPHELTGSTITYIPRRLER